MGFSKNNEEEYFERLLNELLECLKMEGPNEET